MDISDLCLRIGAVYLSIAAVTLLHQICIEVKIYLSDSKNYRL